MNSATLPEGGISFLTSVLQSYGLKVSNIDLSQYDPDCPFPYNNFLYDIIVGPLHATDGLLTEKPPSIQQHGCSALPPNINRRIANSEAQGLNHPIVVQNGIAAMALARQALNDTAYRSIVPEVYAWSPGSEGRNAQPGWSLMDHKSGVQVAETPDELSAPEREGVIRQIAEVFALIQGFEVPSTIAEVGGLGFDDQGNIVSGPMATCAAGPARNCGTLILERIRMAMEEAETHSAIRGWPEVGLRCWILTSHTSEAPLDDFATSFMEFEGNLPGPAAASKDKSSAVRWSAILSAKWKDLPLESKPKVDAVGDTSALHKMFRQAGVVIPQDIRAAAIVSSLLGLPEMIMPALLCNPVMAAGRKEEQRLRDREEAEGDLRSVVEELRKELSLYERMSSDASSA
ncbi:hypothetical protein LTR78_009640 [Recurvomyces mirabilis]|uniref:Uncharacterized protein n=2 Tax=Recurvomyces mirabilis TaxID=574656 RepID=A0AAE0WFC0_9PEZI|nr:hypothetical protein LTR78_009640 [Recurvomyces mirabilis]